MMVLLNANTAETQRNLTTDEHGLRDGAGEKRWRATAVQDLAEMRNGPANAKRLGVRQPSGALERDGHVRALQSRIPHFAWATDSFPEFILGWTMGANGVWILNVMTPLQQARHEWEANTTPHPKKHPLSKFRAEFHTHEFRQFGQAIAWLNWTEDCIEITKFETLQPGGGGPSRLIEFLKTLADKYQVPLWGHARIYEPDPPIPEGHLLTRGQLENFYKKHGFKLRKIDTDTSELSYIPKQN